MRSAQQAIRHCIDSLADDLGDLADELIRQHVASALARIKTPPPSRRAKAEKAPAQPRQPRKKLSPVEKLERAQERKRLRQLALPFAQGAEGEAKARNGRRGRPKATDGASASPKAAGSPPPLFVVKRTRDGNIQTLQRKNEADGAQPNNVPAS